jgi:hypothetical protein
MRWPLYESAAGNVTKVANSVSQDGAPAPSLVFELTPPVALSTFQDDYPEGIEIMAFINASEAATSVTANIPNSATFTVQQETVTTAGTPVNAAALAVPFDRAVTIQNSPLNSSGDLLYIANSSANALLPAARVQLKRSESLVLNVDNFSDIWLNSQNNGTKAVLVVEA